MIAALAIKSLPDYSPSHISTTELKSLLASLPDHAHRINFRYRLMGEMWQPVFMRVLFVTDTGVMLKDELRERTIFLSDIKMIIQFELDGSIYNYGPHFHYDVIPCQLYGKQG